MWDRRIICVAKEGDLNARWNGSNRDNQQDKDDRHRCGGNGQFELNSTCVHAASVCEKTRQQQVISPKNLLTKRKESYG